MTLWKNTSEDTLTFPFDLGRGKRELITLDPQATVEIPNKYDSVVHHEAPQLTMVKDIPEPIVVVQAEPTKPKKKKKDQ